MLCTIVLATGPKSTSLNAQCHSLPEDTDPSTSLTHSALKLKLLNMVSTLHVIFVSEKQELPALKQTSPCYQQGCLPCLGSAALSTQCHLPAQPTAAGDGSFKTITKQRKRLNKLKCNLTNRTDKLL